MEGRIVERLIENRSSFDKDPLRILSVWFFFLNLSLAEDLHVGCNTSVNYTITSVERCHWLWIVPFSFSVVLILSGPYDRIILYNSSVTSHREASVMFINTFNTRDATYASSRFSIQRRVSSRHIDRFTWNVKNEKEAFHSFTCAFTLPYEMLSVHISTPSIFTISPQSFTYLSENCISAIRETRFDFW